MASAQKRDFEVDSQFLVAVRVYVMQVEIRKKIENKKNDEHRHATQLFSINNRVSGCLSRDC